MRFFRQWILTLVFAIWWGGFTFYASFVVPIGNHVLGSKVRQGMITQQVTNKLNYWGVLTLAVCGVALMWGRKREPRAAWICGLISWIVMTACLVLLFSLHGKLDALLDPVRRTVLDDAQFHPMHEVYLTISAVQWFAGIVFWAYLARQFNRKTAVRTDELA